MIASSLVTLLMLQASAQVGVAIHPDNPETWVVEYPAVIVPYVDGYYNCLRSGGYEYGGGKNFETQHRADLPRCAEKGATLEQEANERLARSAVGKTTPPDKVASVFETIRAIHIARGRDLDKTLAFNIEQTRRYVGDPPAQRRLDPADSAECLARVAEIDAARAEYDQANTARIESLYEKRKYTDEDRREIAEYQRKLAAFANRIFFERQQCAAAQ